MGRMTLCHMAVRSVRKDLFGNIKSLESSTSCQFINATLTTEGPRPSLVVRVTSVFDEMVADACGENNRGGIGGARFAYREWSAFCAFLKLATEEKTIRSPNSRTLRMGGT